MSASAKPTEKLFKSFLAVVLAISFCPLMPADKAQAEEAGDSAGPADAAQMSDEGLGGDADPTESALAASNSDAVPELAEENNNAEDEGALDDSNVALQAANDSGAPIVNWTECGTCQWMIDSSGCLIIEPQSGETGELEDWTGSKAPWLKYKNSIISATIKKTVIAKTTQKAFYDCKSLRSIDLSGLDTSSVIDMSFMFYGCSKLSSLDLSSFDTSQVTGMSGMFYHCSSLASLDLSSFGTSNVESMFHMFYGCSKLSSLDLSSFDTSKVTSMGGMFYGCSKLASLDLSSLDTSSVTSMSSMFSGCSSLKSLDLSSLDTSSVTDMSSMFRGCSKLVELNLSSLDTSKVKEGSRSEGGMSSMFSGCSSLVSLDLSSFDTSNVTGMGGMFSGCSKLATLDLSSFNTSNVKGNSGSPRGMSEMFSGCSSLINLDLSSFDTSNVGYMSRMFDGCLRLETLNLSSFNARSVVDMDSMFKGCQSLKTILFPAVLNTPKVTNFSSMFSGCRSLEGLDVSGFDTSAAKSLSSMFYGCTKLAALDVSGFDTSAAKSLSSMFSGCTKLAALDVSNFDTSAATSLDWMFYGCESLTSLDLSSFDTSAADYQYGLSSFLDGCKSLRTVTLGQEFAFEGAGLDRQCSLPTPRGDRLTGRWVSSADGMAYDPNDIPSNTAASYTAQVAAFADVDYSDSSWYGDAVSFVASKGLITGYSGTTLFGVGDVLTRAQLATILWRNACPDEYASYDPETAKDTTGIDGSADGMYYTAAANWAVKNGVITGFDREDGSKDFAADENVSFEQLITILSRLCATPDELAAAGSDLSAFADGDLASSWSRGAFAWAAAKGLVQGYDEPTGKYLRPGDPVARERVAVVLMRAFEMGIMK